MFKKLLLTILCLISVNTWAQTRTNTSQRNNLALATVAYGSVTSSFTSFLANSSKYALLDLDILNLTDANITCSYDAGSTSHFVVAAQSSYSPKLGDIGRHHTSSIYCKYTTAAPTTGNVYLWAGY